MHELDMSINTERGAMAYVGQDPWHMLGTKMSENASIEEWSKAAGLDWKANLLPVLFERSDITGYDPLENVKAVVRNDTHKALGIVSNRYKVVQPREALEFISKYIVVDDRFQLDTAGALKEGAVIWALASFNGPKEIAGDKHNLYVLFTTSFDASSATKIIPTTIRVVCNNTLTAAAYKPDLCVSIRHNTEFNEYRKKEAVKVLAESAESFTEYKDLAESLARRTMHANEIKDFFFKLLEIPSGSKQEDISTRKQNQYSKIVSALTTTAIERATERSSTQDAFTVLNAVTRYVDHDRGAENASESAKLHVANFGSGQIMKKKAFALLSN